MDDATRGTAHSEVMYTHLAIAARSRTPPIADRRVVATPLRPGPVPTPGADADFSRLSQGYQCSGGLVGADQLAGLMRHGAAPMVSQPISQLARWIVARQVVCVPWRAQTWLPLFQFGDGRACLRPGLAAVMGELGDVFDDWELAMWFALGNSSLGGAAPADRLAAHPVEVWQAARTDRFIATGG
jgi:hypothetical protein